MPEQFDLNKTIGSLSDEQLQSALDRARELRSKAPSIVAQQPISAVETRPFTEAPTLLAQEDPFVNLTEAEAKVEAEAIWDRDQEQLILLDWSKEAFLRSYLDYKSTSMEGITGVVTKVEYRPAHHSPRGLGGWVRQRSDFAEAFPPNPGQWVKEPTSGERLAIKVARGTGQAEGQIISERAILLQLDGEFSEHFDVRPAKLRGYGVNENGRPYLALEWIEDDFKILESYIGLNTGTGNSKPLPEKEAVEIALKLNILLQRFHKADLVHNDIDNILANSFWDPQSRKLRIIDFGNAVNKKLDPQGASFSSDREQLGQLLFRLVTGKKLPRYDQITPADWATMNPATRRVIEKASSLLPQEQSYPQGKEATSEMYADLKDAFNLLRETLPPNSPKP